eukprot:COSAG05_NODE_4792_length_1370_cov_9.682927_3_plen_44_part_01
MAELLSQVATETIPAVGELIGAAEATFKAAIHDFAQNIEEQLEE